MNLTEALKMALAAIRAQKLRSMLTLIGIIAGVASIIAVMTGISVIQNTMEKEMSVLGTTTFQVQKWPAGGFNHDVDWRKIQRRKPVTGVEGIVGESGEAISDLNPDGQVRIHGEIWSATSAEGKIKSGSRVVVEQIKNLRLTVRKAV